MTKLLAITALWAAGYGFYLQQPVGPDARESLFESLHQFDIEIQQVEKNATLAPSQSKAKLQEQAREMRAAARKLRDRMSAADHQAELAWPSAGRVVQNETTSLIAPSII
jgi:hypothetical protein